jgi:hypothetical protein
VQRLLWHQERSFQESFELANSSLAAEDAEIRARGEVPEGVVEIPDEACPPSELFALDTVFPVSLVGSSDGFEFDQFLAELGTASMPGGSS